MHMIICPNCRTVNRPAGLSALTCENCGKTIDPRKTAKTAEHFVRRERRLRKRAAPPVERLGREESDEMMEWVMGLPLDHDPDDEAAPSSSRGMMRFVGSLARPWRRFAAIVRRRDKWLYEDSVVRMDENGVTVNSYFWPGGRKRIQYVGIRSYVSRPLRAWHGQYRVHGLDHRFRWYSRDRHRGEKERAIDLKTGRVIRPVLTPDDIDTVLEILDRKVPSEAGDHR